MRALVVSHQRISRVSLCALLLAAPIWMGCDTSPTVPGNAVGFSSYHFDAGAEGWASSGNGAASVQWNDENASCECKGTGCISLTDASDGVMAFRGPPELRGGANLSSYYGKQLKYRMKVSGGDSWREQLLEWNVMIESYKYGRLTMAFPEAFQVDFPYRWRQAVINLSTTPSMFKGRNRCWQIGGHKASEEEIKRVLSNVTNLLICADFKTGSETAYLDDVMITAPEKPEGPDERICNGLPYMCDMPFDKVVFPGNHNSGSYHLWNCDTGGPAHECFVLNQGKSITGQLNYGIRYFDIDMCFCVYHGEGLVNCHGNATSGPAVRGTLDQFDNFLNSPANRNEVVVITVGDQKHSSIELIQGHLYNELARWSAPEEIHDGELAIFKKLPGDPWPTLGYLVDSNQRIVVFVRDALPPLLNMGALSERDYIHDTWKSRGCTFSCEGVVDDTYASCALAAPDKLVLISVFCSEGLCLKDLAALCNPWLPASLMACMDARANSTGRPLLDVIPNFIIADWTQTYGNIVPNVREFNLWILQESGFPVGASSNLAGDMIREHTGSEE